MCLVSTRISHLITGQAIWALPLGHYLCVFSDARSLITDSIFSHLKPLLNCSLLILSYYFSWQLNKIVTANFSRCSRIPRANARVPATPKNFPNRIERSTFCRDIKWTKQTQSIFNKRTLNDCSELKCVHTKMNGALPHMKNLRVLKESQTTWCPETRSSFKLRKTLKNRSQRKLFGNWKGCFLFQPLFFVASLYYCDEH